MQGSLQSHSPSYCRDAQAYRQEDNGIGELFRDYGEKYLKTHQVNSTELKLIKSIRVCKTPALGGKKYTCKRCGKNKYIYFSCGNSRCPKCQGIKQMQWQDKLSNKLFKVPYQHIVFTMPHRLNSLARRNPRELYNCVFISAWKSMVHCAKDPKNLGAKLGAVMVLHTFGSDLKYHVHVHALVTFGGLSEEGLWLGPKRKKRIFPYRQIRREYRQRFIKTLTKIYPDLDTREELCTLTGDLIKKQWCVHAEPPTANTKTIEEYLGKYICRIGLSKQRFKYNKIHKEVSLSFKDYRKRNSSKERAPIATKTLPPLVAINQIMSHCLPDYFQKSRYYGLHASSSYKKLEKRIPNEIKKEPQSIRTVFQIIKAMLRVEQITCTRCSHPEFKIQQIKQDRQWKYNWITIPSNRGSPDKWKHITRTRPPHYTSDPVISMPHPKQIGA